ncbi:DUF3592 domain-containing protein [Deinococcus sp. Arct2-2]|nr:DUF3592 domain-containing protein [Deinococcus sp. Arct2-2]
MKVTFTPASSVPLPVKVVIFLLSLSFILSFIVSPFIGMRSYWTAVNWPPTTAIVERASLPANLHSGTMRNPQTCEFSYRYSVGGQEFQSGRAGFDDDSSGTSLDPRCRVLADHGLPRVGDRITVLYPLKHPERAVYLRVFPVEEARRFRFGIIVGAVIVAIFLTLKRLELQ